MKGTRKVKLISKAMKKQLRPCDSVLKIQQSIHTIDRKRKNNLNRKNSFSPQPRFSPESKKNQQKTSIQKQSIPSSKQKQKSLQRQTKKSLNNCKFQPNVHFYPKETILQIKEIELQITSKAKQKKNFKAYMMTNEESQKILYDLFDPCFNLIQFKLDKDENQIIQYLNKTSRGKNIYLVGWFEAQTKQHNEYIRDFAIKCNQRNKIYGVQRNNIKMHIMSINQYTRINQMHDPPSYVASQSAKQALKYDRLIYVIQYPYDKIYELKGIYQNFNSIIAKQNCYYLIVPRLQINTIPNQQNWNIQNNYQQFNIGQKQQQKMVINSLEPVQFQGWGTQQQILSSLQQNNNTIQNTISQDILSHFSPILTDQQDNQDQNKSIDIYKRQETAEKQQQIDLAATILNSFPEKNIKIYQIGNINIPNNYFSVNTSYKGYPYLYHHMYNSSPQNIYANPQATWYTSHVGINTHYNPMLIMPKYNIQNIPSSTYYKNPMMTSNIYNYRQNVSHNLPNHNGLNNNYIYRR